jgi:hypothetical protein
MNCFPWLQGSADVFFHDDSVVGNSDAVNGYAQVVSSFEGNWYAVGHFDSSGWSCVSPVTYASFV